MTQWRWLVAIYLYSSGHWRLPGPSNFVTWHMGCGRTKAHREYDTSGYDVFYPSHGHSIMWQHWLVWEADESHSTIPYEHQRYIQNSFIVISNAPKALDLTSLLIYLLTLHPHYHMYFYIYIYPKMYYSIKHILIQPVVQIRCWLVVGPI